jgi:hypothetical protein
LWFTETMIGYIRSISNMELYFVPLCWTGTERPSGLFDRATAWLFTHKVLLPGLSVLERFVARRLLLGASHQRLRVELRSVVQG